LLGYQVNLVLICTAILPHIRLSRLAGRNIFATTLLAEISRAG